jgi:uncharacterized protein YutE (UPF0331/DUF86 family)
MLRELCSFPALFLLEDILQQRGMLAELFKAMHTTNLIELAGENGLLPTDFARRIRGMAGMRNAIVHVYWNLDYAAIYEAVSRLSDFDDFGRYVLQFLQRQK